MIYKNWTNIPDYDMIQIILDTRESELQKILASDDITTEQLDIGDIVFRRGSTNLLIVERKKLSDLVSSLSDGRYKEQKTRLIEYSQKNNFPILYIFEGLNLPAFYKYLERLPEGIRSADYGTLLSCLIHTAVRDRIFTMVTESTEQTADFLLRIRRCMDKYPAEFTGELLSSAGGQNSNWVDTVKIKKADNCDPLTCFQMQMATIPGISLNMAKAISLEYPSWNRLISAFEEWDPPKPKTSRSKVVGKGEMLRELKVGERKLGPKASQKIYDYLFYDE